MKKLAWSIACFLVVACAEPVEPPGDIEPLLASTSEALTELEGDFVVFERDYRRCAAPGCGGYWAKKLNWSYMRCADGDWARRCYAADVDLSGLGFSKGFEGKVLADVEAGRAIVRGGFGPILPGPFGAAPFEASAVYEPVVGREVKGSFFRLGDNGIRCITSPCFSTDIEVLNWPFGGTLSQLDTEALPMSDDMVTRVGQAMADQELLATGHLFRAPKRGLGLDASMLWVPYVSDSKLECKDDNDCEDGYCSCVHSGCEASSCLPWASVGESCESFSIDYRRCQPGLSCFVNPLLVDLGGICATAATMSELEADPGAYAGQLVGVYGNAHQGLAYCTQRACPPEAPCCNACGGEQRLYEDAEALRGGVRLLVGDEYLSCGGNECSIECDRQQGEYMVVGTFGFDEWETPQLDVEEMLPTFFPEFD